MRIQKFESIRVQRRRVELSVAQIIDGLIGVVSLGFITTDLSLDAARRLVLARTE